MLALQVVDVYFPKHPLTNQRQAFCFVTFSTCKVTTEMSSRQLLLTSERIDFSFSIPTKRHKAKPNPCTQAANVAVSQSNRKINGQLVSSIAATADRPMHHHVGQHASPTSAALEAIDLQSQLCNVYARATLGPDHRLTPAAVQHALAGCSAWLGQASLAPSTLVHKPLLTVLWCHSLSDDFACHLMLCLQCFGLLPYMCSAGS